MTEETLFAMALEKHIAERAAFLDEACSQDAALRQRVAALLESHEHSQFLETPAVHRAAQMLGTAETTGPRDLDLLDGAESTPSLDFLAPADKPGSLGRLAHYDILEVVGYGGMGVVLRALDERLHRVVAIKVMAAQLATSATARKRFVREARAAAAVTHDHVVTIHAVEEAGGLPYLAMQYVSGLSLQQRLDKSGPLELREIVRIGMQTAAGLVAAHAQGLIHRDIKPANILLENGVERVKITDFGLARAVADASMTQTGMVAGTPQYMSPEQARGELVDRRSDLFSLGSVLYAMCTGRPPFRADSGIAVLKRVCDDTPRPIRELNSDIPEWLEVLVARLHVKDPAERYQTAAEVAEVLGQRLAELQHPSVAALPPAKQDVGRLRAAARRRWAIAATVLLCLLAGLGMAEVTGVTRLASTVIRLLTPEGTLVIEVEDENVTVQLDGEELRIKGAGPHEVRLRPGQYHFQASKEGKVAKQELISITRGDRRVVTITHEPTGVTNARQALVPRAKLEGHSSWIHSLAFSPDGKTLATGSNDQHVRLWDTATGDLTGEFRGDDGLITSLAYSPDGAILVSASNLAKVRVWDAATFKLLAEAKHDALVRTVAFRRGDSMLASASDDGTVKLWKWDGALVPIRTLREHSAGVWAMSFNPQGSVIASATEDGMLYLWDVESGETLKSARIGWQAQLRLAFSPDGRTIAAGGFDKTVQLRKVDTLESVGTLRGHKECVYSLVFLPDGKTLVSAGGHPDLKTQTSDHPGELKLWDIARLQERFSVDGYEKGICSVALSPDGKTLATGDFANLARLWDVDALLAAAPAGQTASPGTTAERGAFVLHGGKGVAERKFDTLAEAVQGASDGDTIEIHGNGPFISPPVHIGSQALTIRAGEAFRPVIQLSREGVQGKKCLLNAKAALVLEGLELHHRAASDDGNFVVWAQGPLEAANCRFRDGVWAESPVSVCVFRNCELRFVGGHYRSGARWTFENCLLRHKGIGLMPHYDNPSLQDVVIRVQQSTFMTGSASLNACLHIPLAVPSDQPAAQPIRFDVSESIFGGPNVLGFDQTQKSLGKAAAPQPAEAEATFLRVLKWQGERNIFAIGSTSVVWGAHWQQQPPQQPPHGPKSLEEWKRFWDSAEVDSLEGRLRFQGGNLFSRMDADLDQLTPGDFRLRPDSVGYRAGSDGKDLGADVDLVGPGPAYERWKKTPEYQQWLKETGQQE